MSAATLAWGTPARPVTTSARWWGPLSGRRGGRASVRGRAPWGGGGASEGAYASLNLANHVGDHEDRVAENRRRLSAALELPPEPLWLNPVAGGSGARHTG